MFLSLLSYSVFLVRIFDVQQQYTRAHRPLRLCVVLFLYTARRKLYVHATWPLPPKTALRRMTVYRRKKRKTGEFHLHNLDLGNL